MSTESFDVIVIGAGTAGLPCAIAAAEGGARVLVLEKESRIGGTLHYTGGHMSAAGAVRQREKGIEDTPAAHLADINRISRSTAREDLVSIQVENAARTIDWLDERGFNFAPETPRIIYGHEPYETARTYYGPDAGVSVLEVLEAELERVRVSADLEVATNSPVIGLERDGQEWEVSALYRGRDATFRARSVVLATGGFGGDAELFEELEGGSLVSAASPASTGDGIYLAQGLGAGLQGDGTYLPTFGGLPDSKNPGRANWSERQVLTSDRDPLEIYVNRDGERWIAEDEPSIDTKERALVGIPGRVFWTVFDDAMLDASTGKSAMILGREPDDVRKLAESHAGVHSAETVEELAELAGIDPSGLAQSIQKYNEFVESGTDSDFGRASLRMPLVKAPFYAIENHAITLITFTGLDIDEEFRVRTEEGDPINDLYAIGEVIGAGATCGNSFCSGMMVTPALTFGRLLGDRLAAEASAGS